jgi:hypothetical protein
MSIARAMPCPGGVANKMQKSCRIGPSENGILWYTLYGQFGLRSISITKPTAYMPAGIKLNSKGAISR